MRERDKKIALAQAAKKRKIFAILCNHFYKVLVL